MRANDRILEGKKDFTQQTLIYQNKNVSGYYHKFNLRKSAITSIK